MRNRGFYEDRVNRVLDYISEHLDGELTLSRLARVGCFSPFHFHRIFQAITGETLNSHVRRVRLERAATLMKASLNKRITDVAVEVGFAGTAEFSRAFKAHFGRNASAWDRRGPLEKSKICKVPDPISFYTLEELRMRCTAANFRVRLHGSNPFRYVYVRTFNPYGNERLVGVYHSLVQWLADRGTDYSDVVMVGMSLDDPAITPAAKCRYDMGIAFPKGLGGSDILSAIVRSRGHAPGNLAFPSRSECAARGFSIRDFESQQIVSLHCAGDLALVDCAWQFLYRLWLPASAYQPADLPAMEMFVRIPEEIGWMTFDLQACIPVARL